jgi:hypothetical protein
MVVARMLVLMQSDMGLQTKSQIVISCSYVIEQAIVDIEKQNFLH